MEVTSWFLPSNRLGSCSTSTLYEECSEHHRAIPDILPMTGGTAVDTYQLQNKQMRSIGVLTEREAATEVLQEPLATRSLRKILGHRRTRFFTNQGVAAALRRVRGQLACVELSVTVLEAPVSSGPQRCVRTCGLAPASSLPLGRRFSSQHWPSG